MSEKDPLILLFASPSAGAVVVEGSGVQGEEDWGGSDTGETPQKKMKRFTSEGDMRRNVFTRSN
jgi:hypothetical protein